MLQASTNFLSHCKQSLDQVDCKAHEIGNHRLVVQQQQHVHAKDHLEIAQHADEELRCMAMWEHQRPTNEVTVKVVVLHLTMISTDFIQAFVTSGSLTAVVVTND